MADLLSAEGKVLQHVLLEEEAEAIATLADFTGGELNELSAACLRTQRLCGEVWNARRQAGTLDTPVGSESRG